MVKARMSSPESCTLPNNYEIEAQIRRIVINQDGFIHSPIPVAGSQTELVWVSEVVSRVDGVFHFYKMEHIIASEANV